MKVQKRKFWVFSLLILMLVVFSGCDAITQRTGMSATAIADGADDSQAGGGVDDSAKDVPQPSPTIGEGIGGGASEDDEDDDDDDDGKIDPNAIATSIQLTIEAMPTNTAIVITNTSAPEDDSPTATNTPVPPTATSDPDSFTPTVPSVVFTELAQTLTAIVVSSTPTITPTQGPTDESGFTPTVAVVDENDFTATPEGEDDDPDGDDDEAAAEDEDGTCLALRFITDVNVPDGTPIQANQVFFKQWYVQNVGTCKWLPGFQLVEIDTGDALGAATTYTLDALVYPGQYITLTAQMVAPSYTGYYTSYWGLTDESGTFFATSIDGGIIFDQPFYVQIYVLGDSEPSSGGGNGGNVVVTAPPFTPGP